jgi:hypothetical protein
MLPAELHKTFHDHATPTFPHRVNIRLHKINLFGKMSGKYI